MTTAAVGIWPWPGHAWWAFAAAPTAQQITRWYGPEWLTDGEAANRYAEIQETHWGGIAYAWKWDSDGQTWIRQW